MEVVTVILVTRDESTLHEDSIETCISEIFGRELLAQFECIGTDSFLEGSIVIDTSDRCETRVTILGLE
jgi:hypothetical protein